MPLDQAKEGQMVQLTIEPESDMVDAFLPRQHVAIGLRIQSIRGSP